MPPTMSTDIGKPGNDHLKMKNYMLLGLSAIIMTCLEMFITYYFPHFHFTLLDSTPFSLNINVAAPDLHLFQIWFWPRYLLWN